MSLTHTSRVPFLQLIATNQFNKELQLGTNAAAARLSDTHQQYHKYDGVINLMVWWLSFTNTTNKN